MKTLKYFSYFLLLVIGVNLLTWLFYGRDSILLKSPKFFDESCYVGGADTIFVYAGYNDQIKEFPNSSPLGEFRESTKQKVLDSLSQKNNSEIIFHDQNLDDVFPESYDVMYFWANVNRRVPFYARVNTEVYSIGFGANYHESWYWFYKWFPIPNTSVSGCS